MRRVFSALAVALVVAGGGCSQEQARDAASRAADEGREAASDVGEAAESAGARAADTLEGEKVDIRGQKFVPDTVNARVGETVTWTNSDDVEHTVVADSKVFQTRDPLAKGKSFDYRFLEKGEFRYTCTIHPGMTGTVTVT